MTAAKVDSGDESNFPDEGVDVVLPYPNGTDSKDTFQIVHADQDRLEGVCLNLFDRIQFRNIFEFLTERSDLPMIT